MRICVTNGCCQLSELFGLGEHQGVYSEIKFDEVWKKFLSDQIYTPNVFATTAPSQKKQEEILEKNGFTVVAEFPSAYGYMDKLWLWINPTATERMKRKISESS